MPSLTPFVKWAGGKTRLLDEITALLPPDWAEHTYAEPFIGGGAVLLHLRPQVAVINDYNAELVNVYRVVRDRLDELLAHMAGHRNEKEYFYEVRAMDRDEGYARTDAVAKASRFIFLNKTCFNGLYRVNKGGFFNVPFGRYKNPKIVNEHNLRAVSEYLNGHDIRIENTDFKTILDGLEPGSFVYLDPPYYPISQTSNFTGYIEGGWNAADQIRLREACDELTQRGIRFLQSNSSCVFIREQYARYNISTVSVNRTINANPSRRGAVEELLIRNYE